MIVLLFTVILWNTGETLDNQEEDLANNIDNIFNDLIKLNDIDLAEGERDYRLSIFTINCLAQTEKRKFFTNKIRYDKVRLCPNSTLDDIYTEEELNQMDGAVMDNDTPDQLEQLPNNFRKRRQTVPRSYDVRDHVTVSKPVHQGTCGNCYIHAFVSALEIAYTKQTGEFLSFSRQELTDCFYSGCKGGDYRVLANSLSVTDHLSSTANYGPYLSQHTKRQFSCRAGVTKDSLVNIKVEGYKEVTKDTLDYYVYHYGSVMACLDWTGLGGTNNCDQLKTIQDEVFIGDTVPGGCSHAVLIVGYTPYYYIVKNSHGVSWGDEGYFKIQRGTNGCGIEDKMVALITTPRPAPKPLADNGCPVGRPHYCPGSSTCTRSPDCYPVQQHATLISTATLNKKVRRETPSRARALLKRGAPNRRIEDIIKQRIAEQQKARRGRPQQTAGGSKGAYRRPMGTLRGYQQSSSANNVRSFNFLANNVECADQIRTSRCLLYKSQGLCATHFTIKEYQCRKTCGKCFDKLQANDCRDASETCAQLSLALCDVMYRVRRNCPNRCSTCHLVDPEQYHTAVNWMPKEKEGFCNVPRILHGTVITPNNRGYLEPDEELVIQCDPGYTLTGETMSCVIQDVYKPDIRVMPECVRVGEAVLEGNGAEYAGPQDTSTSGRQCLSWKKQVYTGAAFVRHVDLETLANGNNRYCRNTGGSKAVPYCIVSDTDTPEEDNMTNNHTPNPSGDIRASTKIAFCFGHPGCDTCDEAVDLYETEYCEDSVRKGKCDYEFVETETRTSFMWENCRASCCRAADC